MWPSAFFDMKIVKSCISLKNQKSSLRICAQVHLKTYEKIFFTMFANGVQCYYCIHIDCVESMWLSLFIEVVNG
jgi:hypothetical protein